MNVIPWTEKYRPESSNQVCGNVLEFEKVHLLGKEKKNLRRTRETRAWLRSVSLVFISLYLLRTWLWLSTWSWSRRKATKQMSFNLHSFFAFGRELTASPSASQPYGDVLSRSHGERSQAGRSR